MSSGAPLHRLYFHYSELPPSLRVMYSAALIILGFGYLFALMYVYHTQAGKDGGKMLSYEDIVITYSGSGKGSRLEAALHGPMQQMLPADETKAVIAWVQGGAKKEGYDKEIKPLLDKRCMACHDGSNPHLPNLSSYEQVKKVTEIDTGTDVFTLVRVSHIHLFGLTFIFFIVGTIFSHAYVRPVWFKCFVIALPFLCIAADVSSWYFTKLFHPFAWVVMGAGALMGMCFAFMWVVSMWQMWIGKPPAAVTQRSHDTAASSVG
jgi:hypothetical protein